jgi:pimeloyl-ACP methyl ester carboxylesterase
MKNDFEFIDRKHRETLVLLPGWATDARVFSALDVPYNYFLARQFDPFTLEQDLLHALDAQGIKQCAILGFSMGGFTAVRFAHAHHMRVSKLFLIGIRERYPKKQIAFVREHVEKDCAGYLANFYVHSFHHKDAMVWFKKHLYEAYCQEMKKDELVKGLDYLAEHDIAAEYFHKDIPVTFIHGQEDDIAPFEEMRRIKNSLFGAHLHAVPGAGHLCFLEKDVSSVIK